MLFTYFHPITFMFFYTAKFISCTLCPIQGSSSIIVLCTFVLLKALFSFKYLFNHMTLSRALFLNNTFSFKLCPIADVFSIRETDFCSIPLTVLKVLIWEIFISPFYILHLHYFLSSTQIDVLKLFYRMFGIFCFPFNRLFPLCFLHVLM